jgi:hypothetical protein
MPARWKNISVKDCNAAVLVIDSVFARIPHWMVSESGQHKCLVCCFVNHVPVGDMESLGVCFH